jgi:hypothetical protein
MNDDGRLGLPFQQAFEHFWINPQTTWDRFFNPQIFVSYNSADAGIENHVLRRAGSYGKQLGRILDVLDVLVARLPAAELTSRERLVMDRFHELARRVDSAVDDYRGTKRPTDRITLGDVDRVVDGLHDLARTDPAAHRVAADRLRRALGAPPA